MKCGSRPKAGDVEEPPVPAGGLSQRIRENTRGRGSQPGQSLSLGAVRVLQAVSSVAFSEQNARTPGGRVSVSHRASRRWSGKRLLDDLLRVHVPFGSLLDGFGTKPEERNTSDGYISSARSRKRMNGTRLLT